MRDVKGDRIQHKNTTTNENGVFTFNYITNRDTLDREQWVWLITHANRDSRSFFLSDCIGT